MGYPNITQEINTIKSTYLPLSGGVMTGKLRTESDIVINTNTNIPAQTRIFYNKGSNIYESVFATYEHGNTTASSCLVLRSETSPSPNSFFLRAGNSNSTHKILLGKPDGTLTWNGEQLATRHIQTYPATSSEQQPVVSELCVIRGTTDNAPNNSCILSFGNSQSWFGQLCIIDNAEQGIWRRGTSDGVMGDWYRLLDQQICKSYVTATYTSGNNGYRKYSDGFIEQWGYINAPSSGAFQNTAVTLHHAFTNINYNINLGTQRNTNLTDGWGYYLGSVGGNKTTTNFSVFLDNTTYVTGLYWHACGY